MSDGLSQQASQPPLAGGGGGGGTPPVVAVGPTFGPGNSNDQGVSGVIRSALTMPALALVGLVKSLVKLTMPSLAVTENPQVVQAALSMPTLTVVENLQQVRAAVSMPVLSLVGGVGAKAALTMPTLAETALIQARPQLKATALGAPFWQSVRNERAVNATDITLFVPVDTQPGDLLLAFVATANVVALGVALVSTPSGWTQIHFRGMNGTVAALGLYAFYRVADGTEPGPILFTFSPNAGISDGEVHRVNGAASATVTFPDSPWASGGKAATFRNACTGIDLGSATLLPSGVGAAGAFCYETKIQVNTTPVDPGSGIDMFMGSGSNALLAGTERMRFKSSGNGQLSVTFRLTDNTRFGLSTASAFTYGVKHDVALSFDGSTIRLFIDGASVQSASIPGIEAASASYRFLVGKGLDGIMDEIRVSNVARYTANYIPATVPFTTDGNTVGLWHLDDSAFVAVDSSGNGNHGAVPLDAPLTSASLLASALTPDPVSPSFNTTVANMMVFSVLAHHHAALTQSHTPPAGMDERTDTEGASNPPGTLMGLTTDTKVFGPVGLAGAATHDCTETVSTDAAMLRIAIAPGTLVLL